MNLPNFQTLCNSFVCRLLILFRYPLLHVQIFWSSENLSGFCDRENETHPNYWTSR